MQLREFFHGADGDRILSIMNWKEIRPNAAGEIFFSAHHPEWVLMHGPDSRRRASFAVRLEVAIPHEVQQHRRMTDGVLDTIVLKTARPLRARVLELYVRRLHEGRSELERILGEHDIREFLKL